MARMASWVGLGVLLVAGLAGCPPEQAGGGADGGPGAPAADVAELPPPPPRPQPGPGEILDGALPVDPGADSGARGETAPAAPEGAEPPATGVAPRGERSGGQAHAASGTLPLAPQAGALRVEVQPPRPRPEEPFTIRGGPVTFRNGCEGVDRVAVQRTGERVEVRWWPREVPPDAMCTMALHDEWVEARVEGLPAGRYTAEVVGVGRTPFEVGL